MIQKYPTAEESENFPAEEAAAESLMKAIRAVRAIRAERNVPQGKRTPLYVAGTQYDDAILKKLAYASDVIYAEPANPSECAAAITEDARIFIPLAELVDLEAEKARIAKELDKAQKNLDQLKAKLANSEFTSKAPAHVIDAEREKLAKAEALIKQLTTP
jgi:valyl-tRNA synthetase